MAAQFNNAFAQYGGVEITIRIPVAAGLAGGLQMRQQSW